MTFLAVMGAAIAIAIMFCLMVMVDLYHRIARMERIEDERRAIEDAELEKKLKTAYEKPTVEYINGCISNIVGEQLEDYSKFYKELIHLYEEEAKEKG